MYRLIVYIMSLNHHRQTHKIAVLTYLLITELNDIKANSLLAKEIITQGEAFEQSLEPMLEVIFESKEISKGTYLNELGIKVETVIRKNYERITE